MCPGKKFKGDAKNGETSWAEEEEAQMKKSGVQPSQEKITTMKEEETRKNMKYTEEASSHHPDRG
jgi:hypothetical protein